MANPALHALNLLWLFAGWLTFGLQRADCAYGAYGLERLCVQHVNHLKSFFSKRGNGIIRMVWVKIDYQCWPCSMQKLTAECLHLKQIRKHAFYNIL